MASVLEVTKATAEALGGAIGSVSVQFVEEYDKDKLPNKVVTHLRAMAKKHPPHNPHKVIEGLLGPAVEVPQDKSVPRGALEVLALDNLMGVIGAEKARKELERARALVAAADAAKPAEPAFVPPELPETPGDLLDTVPEESGAVIEGDESKPGDE